jgi:two-component system sensor histidine kinase AlgZ
MVKNEAYMASIKQNPGISMPAGRLVKRLPDMRNLGIGLRILILVNLLALTAAIVQSPVLTEITPTFIAMSALVQPALLLSLLLLYVAYPALRQLPYGGGMAATMALVALVLALLHCLGNGLLGAESLPPLSRSLALGFIASAIVLYYLDLRYRALSPAIAEARLQALQARIRPHFLFNSINAVLSLMRSHPRRAETALEDMAELFRVLMADNRELVPLAQELALCRQYLALEKLRLDERLTINWQIESMPPDALVPPLVLQPLLENAVYHGIEPLPEGGEIIINIHAERNAVHIELSNPYSRQHAHHSGNKMALTNIRERLTLHFDVEASLTSKAASGRYVVHIRIPYHPAR